MAGLCSCCRSARRTAGTRLRPVRLHPVRPHRDLAGAARRLGDRPGRPAADGGAGRGADRRRLDAERPRRHADHAVCRLGAGRARGGHRLWRHRGQRAEMVPRPPRPGDRPDRGRVRRRLGAEPGADRGLDRGARLRLGFPGVRRGAGRRGGGWRGWRWPLRPAPRARPAFSPPARPGPRPPRRAPTSPRSACWASRCSG